MRQEVPKETFDLFPKLRLNIDLPVVSLVDDLSKIGSIITERKAPDKKCYKGEGNVVS